MNEKFRLVAERIATIAGTPRAFLLALLMVVLWAVSGPLFGFSDTWQLIINTGTTIVTFLMVFLIQNAQNREAVAVQLKLDELIRAVRGARMGMINIHQLSDEDLALLRREFQRLGDEDGGCDELQASISTDKDVHVTVRARFDSEGKVESREVDQTEGQQRRATAGGEKARE